MSWTYLITGNTEQKLKMLFKLNAVRVHRGFEKQRKGATSVCYVTSGTMIQRSL